MNEAYYQWYWKHQYKWWARGIDLIVAIIIIPYLMYKVFFKIKTDE